MRIAQQGKVAKLIEVSVMQYGLYMIAKSDLEHVTPL